MADTNLSVRCFNWGRPLRSVYVPLCCSTEKLGQDMHVSLPIDIRDVLHAGCVESGAAGAQSRQEPGSRAPYAVCIHQRFPQSGRLLHRHWRGERRRTPSLAPVGLPLENLDRIEKDILVLEHRSIPYRHPITALHSIDGRHILALWAGEGQRRDRTDFEYGHGETRARACDCPHCTTKRSCRNGSS